MELPVRWDHQVHRPRQTDHMVGHPHHLVLQRQVAKVVCLPRWLNSLQRNKQPLLHPRTIQQVVHGVPMQAAAGDRLPRVLQVMELGALTQGAVGEVLQVLPKAADGVRVQLVPKAVVKADGVTVPAVPEVDGATARPVPKAVVKAAILVGGPIKAVTAAGPTGRMAAAAGVGPKKAKKVEAVAVGPIKKVAAGLIGKTMEAVAVGQIGKTKAAMAAAEVVAAGLIGLAVVVVALAAAKEQLARVLHQVVVALRLQDSRLWPRVVCLRPLLCPVRSQCLSQRAASRRQAPWILP